jgi:endonuclease/exonuclease/phosphatase family metal-dependent hydrolase
MTWNIQRGQALTGRLTPADMAPFAARVTANRADVVGLQEVTQEQAAAMAALLGWPSARYVETKNPCPGYPPPAPAACVPFGNAILSRLPLGEAAHWPLPASNLEAGVEARVLLRSVVDSGGRKVSVYVTHLASGATAGERAGQRGRSSP